MLPITTKERELESNFAKWDAVVHSQMETTLTLQVCFVNQIYYAKLTSSDILTLSRSTYEDSLCIQRDKLEYFLRFNVQNNTIQVLVHLTNIFILNF